MPLVILVNRYTGSGAELLAGSLQEHRRAIIVGERTCGRGTIQMLWPLDARAAYLKLTTDRQHLPSGRAIDRGAGAKDWGVVPDIQLPLPVDRSRENAGDDLALATATVVQRLMTAGATP